MRFLVLICGVALTALSGCGVTINTRGTNVPLEITAELTVDNRQIIQTWSVPGVPARESSKRPGIWSTYPALGSVFVRLPSGEGLWIDTAYNSPHLNDVPGAAGRYQSTFFYFVDSASNPQVLTDYYNTVAPERCPQNFRIRNCEINLTVKRLPDGPPIIGRDVGGGDGIGFGYPDRLRTGKLALAQKSFFLSLSGTMHLRVSRVNEDALLGPLVQGRDRPVVLRLDQAGVRRILELARNSPKPEGGRIHLRYLGDGRWAAPDTLPDTIRAAAIRQVGYRIQIDPADLECCSGDGDPIKPKRLPAFAGKVEWRGDTLTYDPVVPSELGLYWNVLYDPRDETAIILTYPHVKRVWQVPADISGG